MIITMYPNSFDNYHDNQLSLCISKNGDTLYYHLIPEWIYIMYYHDNQLSFWYSVSQESGIHCIIIWYQYLYPYHSCFYTHGVFPRRSVPWRSRGKVEADFDQSDLVRTRSRDDDILRHGCFWLAWDVGKGLSDLALSKAKTIQQRSLFQIWLWIKTCEFDI